MSRKVLAVVITLSLLFSNVFTGCENENRKLQNALSDYSRMLEGPLPKNLRLTIYYVDPTILTYAPVSVDRLKQWPDVQIIEVEAESLAEYTDLLGTLNASVLQPAKENTCIDARLYYVFETDDIRLLEIIIRQIHGNVFVNGIEVENNPVFYEIIKPFLTEDAYNTLGI